MPTLRTFHYKGFPVKFSLISPTPGLTRVDLDTCRRQRSFYKCEPATPMLANFSSTRALKLHLITIEEIIFDPNDESGDHTDDQNPGEATILPTFPNLKLLEIDGTFKYRNRNTALALATLLRACPTMSELRLTLHMAYDYHYDRKTKERENGGPFTQSVERFKMLASMCTEHRNDVELGTVSDLPGPFTSSCTSFSCLRTSLRNVTLQFKSKELNCFPVQLAKFLVENAMVLEEMHVEDGDQFWPDHLWDKLARWRADAFRRRNLPETAAGFRVYQLANPVEDPRVHY